MASPAELVAELLSGLHALDPRLLGGINALELFLSPTKAQAVCVGGALSSVLEAALPKLKVGGEGRPLAQGGLTSCVSFRYWDPSTTRVHQKAFPERSAQGGNETALWMHPLAADAQA